MVDSFLDRVSVSGTGLEPYVRLELLPQLGQAEGVPACILGGSAQLLLDAQQSVVLRDALAAGGRAGLDLAGARRDDEVGDGRVFGLAAAMADDRRPAGLLRHRDGVQRLGQGADLVELDQDGVRGALADALGQALRVGDEEVVADELDVAAELGVELPPAGPVVLRQAVLDADDGVLGAPALPVGDQLLAAQGAPFFRPGRTCFESAS